jgi:hypothetical protein
MALSAVLSMTPQLWNQTPSAKNGTVAQIEQLVRIAREFGQPIAMAQQAREISKIDVFYKTTEESLLANGFAPNCNGANQGFLRKAAWLLVDAVSHGLRYEHGNVNHRGLSTGDGLVVRLGS